MDFWWAGPLNGNLAFGIISCPELLPDLWELADEFSSALDELLAYVDA
ncbi:WS/DGAT domain-containing protein [Mycobacterium sp.]